VPFAGLRLAIGTLTIIPSGEIGEIDAAMAGRAMLLAPLAVLPLAAAAGLVGGLASWAGLPGLAVGLLVVGVLALGSRAMHLDGLADTVDGLGSGWDRERALTIMRRGDVGPMGVVALVIILGLQAVAFGTLVHGLRGAVTAVVIIVGSRAALSLVCRHGVPSARPTGLGVAVAGSVPRWAVVGQWVVVMLIMATLVFAGWARAGVIIGLGVAAAATVLLVQRCVRRLGGVTGDVMGAAIEIALTVLALGAVA
jgi:adenosylcobinamide-GDP ribazoletransferase